jgi:hypothetical protein
MLMLLAWFTCSNEAFTKDILAENSDDPTKTGLMTPSAKSELDDCIAQAAQTAGDDRDRHVMVGVYIGSKGRPVSLALLESSGLEQLDKLVLRCIFRANYLPAAPDKPPIHWVFTTSLRGKRSSPSGEIASLHEPVSEAQVLCA